MIKRRLYYSVYCSIIKKGFSEKHYELFMNVLIGGCHNLSPINEKKEKNIKKEKNEMKNKNGNIFIDGFYIKNSSNEIEELISNNIFEEKIINSVDKNDRNDKNDKINSKFNNVDLSDFIEIENKAPKRVKKALVSLFPNFETLDQLVLDNEIYGYLSKKYSVLTADVYNALISNINILSFSFFETFIEILSGKNTENVENLNKSYNNFYKNITRNDLINQFKYLVSSGFVIENVSSSTKLNTNGLNFGNNLNSHNHLLDKVGVLLYIPVRKIEILKYHKISSFLNQRQTRRVFNMILVNDKISDNDLTVNSLLPLSQQKSSLLTLLKLGLIKEDMNFPFKQAQRITHEFYINDVYLSSSILKTLEKQLYILLINRKPTTQLNTFTDDVNSNFYDNSSFKEKEEEFCNHSIDHLIFNIFK